MRRFIIDTDTASDDAAAIILAAKNPDIRIEGATAVAGNVEAEQAALNALAALEACGCDAPVYLGARRPLFRPRTPTISVHGRDGMGDKGIVHPQKSPGSRRAVEFILDTVSRYPGEVEIAVLGPATNIALAILTDRDTMKKAKHIWSMATPGFGPGNATPVAEFNVFLDAEAYALMLGSGVPVTIAGFDLCEGEIKLDAAELARLEQGGPLARFLYDATSVLARFNERARGEHVVDLPDAVAIAAAFWPEFVQEKVLCHCRCCTENGPTYGQVIFYQDGRTYEAVPEVGDANAEVITQVDGSFFTQKLMQALSV